LIAAASDCVIVSGVPAGAATMIHEEASYPGTPPSLIVGSSGRRGDRTAVLMPSARTRPSRMTGRKDIRLSTTSWIRPVMRSVSDSVVALYDTNWMSTPAIDLNNSADRNDVAPAPIAP